jgi:Family of unknown function (DUF6494)
MFSQLRIRTGTRHCAIRSTNVPRAEAVLRAIHERAIMDEETLNISVRKFLKTLGVTAQREIEKAVRDAVSSGQLKDCPSLPAKAVVTVGGINLKFEIESAIELA